MAPNIWSVIYLFFGLFFFPPSFYSFIYLVIYILLYDFQIAPNPMYVRHAREIPEYEIDPKELDFTNSVEIDKVKILIDVFHIVLSQCSVV